MKKEAGISEKKIHPVADRVLVKRENAAHEKSPSGIIIPDTAAKEKSKTGLVIAVGPGRFGDEGDLIPMTVKAGSRVIFNAGWDNEVNMDSDEEYFLIEEKNILAIIK